MNTEQRNQTREALVQPYTTMLRRQQSDQEHRENMAMLAAERAAVDALRESYRELAVEAKNAQEALRSIERASLAQRTKKAVSMQPARPCAQIQPIGGAGGTGSVIEARERRPA